MYSVILAAMLTTSQQEVQWHHGHSCGGYNAFSYGCSCYGCYGCYGCHGCSGCSGYSYGGYVPVWSRYTVGYTYWGSGCYGSWCTCSGSGWSLYGCLGCAGS